MDSKEKETIHIESHNTTIATDVQHSKTKPKKPKNPLNNSAFRTFALAGGYVQMVSPTAIDAMQSYVNKYLLKPIIKKIFTFTTHLLLYIH